MTSPREAEEVQAWRPKSPVSLKTQIPLTCDTSSEFWSFVWGEGGLATLWSGSALGFLLKDVRVQVSFKLPPGCTLDPAGSHEVFCSVRTGLSACRSGFLSTWLCPGFVLKLVLFRLALTGLAHSSRRMTKRSTCGMMFDQLWEGSSSSSVWDIALTFLNVNVLFFFQILNFLSPKF